MSGTMVTRKQAGEAAEEPGAARRNTIINLKGTAEQAAWLERVHLKTHIPKSVIVRLALGEWAGRNGHPPFPAGDGEGGAKAEG
jgi:hypothetical protein